VIPHGIDIDRFRPTQQVIKESEKIKTRIKKPIILFVGRLVYYKGLEYLIRAMKGVDAKLIIIGNGPQRFKLKIMAKLLRVDHKILWRGEVSDEMLPIYYHACDLFVLPSCADSESFGLVILEAHASGKPVVSTDLPTGVTFTNLHQKTGLVVLPRDVVALRDAINHLLSSKALREKYGRRGRERVEREFTKETMGRNIMRLYTTLLSSADTASAQ
jgi:rhamnosyl/mannosyltransferase